MPQRKQRVLLTKLKMKKAIDGKKVKHKLHGLQNTVTFRN
jgi:hypothetical protein